MGFRSPSGIEKIAIKRRGLVIFDYTLGDNVVQQARPFADHA